MAHAQRPEPGGAELSDGICWNTRASFGTDQQLAQVPSFRGFTKSVYPYSGRRLSASASISACARRWAHFLCKLDVARVAFRAKSAGRRMDARSSATRLRSRARCHLLPVGIERERRSCAACRPGSLRLAKRHGNHSRAGADAHSAHGHPGWTPRCVVAVKRDDPVEVT